jgi:hypothetical protein
MCLSCLLVVGRHAELFEVLTLNRRQDWHDRKFGVRALLGEGKTEEAPASAEGSREQNQPDAAFTPPASEFCWMQGAIRRHTRSTD